MKGDCLNERYQIEKTIGQGGMGTVYRAQDLLLDRPVAVKVLKQIAFGTEGRARFLSEVKNTAKLNHPNIVTVFDAGEHEGQLFLIMELIEGEPLSRALPDGLEQICRLVEQICQALAHAHSQGIIHRDIKPENVMRCADGNARLMDFGIARSTSSQLTEEGTFLGTLSYISPEQAMGAPIDARADLYSLGVLMYELLTGQLPFESDDPLGVITQHLHAPVVPPHTRNSNIPRGLDALVVDLLNKSPEDRPASASEVLRRLEAVRSESLGVDPAEETKMPYEGLREGESLPGAPNDERLPGGPDGQPRHNLQLSLPNLIGREEDLTQIAQHLGEPGCRLLTLIGVGGIGKTRLGLHASAAAVDPYPDGVWLVELAALNEAELLPDEIAAVFGVSAQEARSGVGVTDVLIDYLKDKTLLLVLDNCEHLIETCAVFAEKLLNGCPKVKILATSREAFGLYEERIFQVAPLSFPPQDSPVRGREIYPAMQLFIERAARAQPGFHLTEDNSTVLAEICWQLDGIPLAIELAAARVRFISLDQIARRLQDRFRLLTGGPRTALPRHQTLQATMDWSYDLLSQSERSLLRRLAVFSGGWTLKAAEEVVNFGDLAHQEVLDLLCNLVDKSLVLVAERGARTRYGMLETVRQYGLRMLSEGGEEEESRQRHADFFVQLAEQTDEGLRDARQVESLAVLDAEHDNLRGALRWATDNKKKDLAFRLVGALGWYWFMRGHWKESWRWFHKANEVEADSNPILRAKAICRAVGLEIIRGNLIGTVELISEAVEICRQAGDEEGLAWGLNLLGQAKTWVREEWGNAIPYLSESTEIFRGLENEWGVAFSVRYIGQVTDLQGDYERGSKFQKKGIEIFERIGDAWNQAHSLFLLGSSATANNDYEVAKWALEQSLEKCSLIGDKVMEAHALRGLGQLAFQQDDREHMEEIFLEALEALQKIGDENCVAYVLRGLGEVAQRNQDFSKAALLFGQSLHLYKKLGVDYMVDWLIYRYASLAEAVGKEDRAAKLLGASAQIAISQRDKSFTHYQKEREKLTASVRAIVGDLDFDLLCKEGAALSREEAVAFALEEWPEA